MLRNVRYFSAPRNDFIMIPAELQTYRKGERAFESKRTNGFMITVDINASNIQQASKGGTSGQ